MPPIARLTDRQRRALATGKTVQWAADAFQIPRPRLVAMVAAEGLTVDPATDRVHVRQVIPTGIRTTNTKEIPMASDTSTVLDALRSGTPVPQVADEHGWSPGSVRALVNGQRGWRLDPADESVLIGVGRADEDEDVDEEPAPTLTPAETVAGGIEQLLVDARASGEKRLERAAGKVDAAVAALLGLYEPWLAAQNEAQERAAKLAEAEKRAAKLQAQAERAQAEVAELKGKSAKKSRPTAAGISREKAQAIRAWAPGARIEVKPVGRIPAWVIWRFDAAHAGGGGDGQI